MLSSISPGCQCPPLAAAWKTRTPRSAPTGSTSTPSQVSSDRHAGAGRTKDSSGSTTVGPETTRMAPIRRATRRSIPSTSRAVERATASQVTSAPMRTRRATSLRASAATAPSDSRSPASNRITPTAIETNGW